ncbi:MAG: AzlD domain-containing protein [Acidimicrobiia bacterium]|nr:AzlD domain-containing protein [Acidimicrobiia bacterium]MDH5503318.1 AzlD domain-containing protein [Acidimicrobiia bacterium]
MTGIWIGIGVLTLGAYLAKLLGFTALKLERLPEPAADLARLLPIALFAALVVVTTVTDGPALSIDARLAGVTVAGVAAWRKAPFLVVVLAAMIVTGGIRALR